MIITNSPLFLPQDLIQTLHLLQKKQSSIKPFTFLSREDDNVKSQLHSISSSMLLDSNTREIALLSNALLVDGIANYRLVDGLFSLLECEPDVAQLLETKLHRYGLALDMNRLLRWNVVNSSACSGIHPLVLTYGYRITTLVVSSVTTAASAGQTLTRDIVEKSPAFQYILQVYGQEELSNLLQKIFAEVEGLRGTLQQLSLQKSQQLREEEKSRFRELEDQLRPELNISEKNLQTNIRSELSAYGMYNWENGIGHMVAKTPQASQKLFSSWLQLPLSNKKDIEHEKDQAYAQEWVQGLEKDPLLCDIAWKFLPLASIKSSIRALIKEENEEFLHFCEALSTKPNLTSKMPYFLSSNLGIQ